MEFAYYISPSSAMQKISENAIRSSLYKKFIRSGYTIRLEKEICPTFVVPVLASDKNKSPCAFLMKWGFEFNSAFVPYITAPQICANQDFFKTHRCIIPASWYTCNGQLVLPADSAGLWFAGFYTLENQLPSFSIFISNGRPVLLAHQSAHDWIHPDHNAQEALKCGSVKSITYRLAK